MGTTTLVSVEEYLRTSFPDADREYVDGRIVERNVGEVDHSDVQSSILHYLRTHYKKGIWAGVEVRVQVKKTRFRIPDVTVMPGSKPAERVIRKPPIVAVKVLSPDDRAGYLEEKIRDSFNDKTQILATKVDLANSKTDTIKYMCQDDQGNRTEGSNQARARHESNCLPKQRNPI